MDGFLPRAERVTKPLEAGQRRWFGAFGRGLKAVHAGLPEPVFPVVHLV